MRLEMRRDMAILRCIRERRGIGDKKGELCVVLGVRLDLDGLDGNGCVVERPAVP